MIDILIYKRFFPEVKLNFARLGAVGTGPFSHRHNFEVSLWAISLKHSAGTEIHFESSQPTEPEALAQYARRVGAERRNFRRYVIREQQRDLYHFDRYVIKIAADGGVEVREAQGGNVPDDIPPTAEEAAAIQAACASADWPKAKAAGLYHVGKLRERLRESGHEPILFLFHDPDDHITFVQQRLFKKDEAKVDLPWSYWSDDEWRCMEPDFDRLPLYGLEQLNQRLLMRVYVHEGAKTAWFLQQTDGAKEQWWRDHYDTEAKWRDRCPWAKELDTIRPPVPLAHIGWPGGAPNPHRVDWSPLKRLPPHVDVIVVCDHDPAGENAASKISFELQRRMKVLRFGADFPRKFDLSDPFPEELYRTNDEGVRVYRRDAPTLERCLEPATWATTADYRLRAEFVEEWLYTVQPAYFLHTDDLSRRYLEKEFNALVAPFSHGHVKDVAALLHKQHSAQGQTVIYNPARRSGRINYNGKQVVNVYRATPIRPCTGDPKPWLDFMDYLIPDEGDRKETLQWCATLIACPNIRMLYSLLLISETTGIGKTTLADILASELGYSNCSFPSAETITDSTFNSWVAYRRLAVIAEIYAGHSTKTFNKLKAIITDRDIHLNEKYVKEHWIENWVQIFATSNSYNALKIDDQDRRWFVPGVVEEKKPLEYFISFRKWLEERDGYEIIAQWALTYVKEHGHVLVGAHAPTSAAKRKVIEEAYSEGERIVLAWGRRLAGLKRKIADDQYESIPAVVRQDSLRDWLASCRKVANPNRYGNDRKQFLESPQKIASILRHGCRLHLPKQRFEDSGGKFRVVANFKVEESATWPELKTCCIDPGAQQLEPPY